MYRLQLQISDELRDRLEAQSSKLGITRSSYCVMKLAQGVQADEMAWQSYASMSDQLGNLLQVMAEKELSKK